VGRTVCPENKMGKTACPVTGLKWRLCMGGTLGYRRRS